MTGTKNGGLKTAATNKERYGLDFYVGIGSKGGLAKVKKGFAVNRELARTAGRKGGLKSRKTAK